MNVKIKYLFLLTSLFYFAGEVLYAQPYKQVTLDSLEHYNSLLSSKEMKEDLIVLRKVHEQANSGLYYYRTKSEVDSLYCWAYSKIDEPLHKIDFYKIILQIVDFEGSVHNYTELDRELIKLIERQKTYFPHALRFIEGNIIFDGTTTEIPSGSKILKINNVEASKLMESFYKYFPADGFTKTKKLSASVERSFDLYYQLEYGLTDQYKVEFVGPEASTSKIVTIPAVSLSKSKENHKIRFSAPVLDKIDFKSQAPYSFELLEASIGLLNLRWFGFVTGEEDPKFPKYVQFLDSVFTILDERKVQHLIIDVRNNPGGSDPTFEQPVMYLTDRSFKENESAHIIFDPNDPPYPDYFWGVYTIERITEEFWTEVQAFLKERYPIFKKGMSIQDKKYNPTYTPKQPQFKGNLYLIINENVGSAASHFASLVKGFVENVVIVGVETVGGYYVHNGHVPFVYELPNSQIKTQFSIVHVLQDAPQEDDQPKGRGIIPDYEVWPTLVDYFKQKDTQMEFIIKYIETNK